jgi:hypothetical protein
VIRLRFRGQERLLVGVGVLGEAQITWRPLGGNEVEVESLEGLDDEQRGELIKLVRDPLESSTAAVLPVAAVDTGADAVGALVGAAPPRAGQGSSREAWVAHAEKLTAAGVPVVVTDTMGRDEIVAAVDQALEDHRAR